MSSPRSIVVVSSAHVLAADFGRASRCSASSAGSRLEDRLDVQDDRIETAAPEVLGPLHRDIDDEELRRTKPLTASSLLLKQSHGHGDHSHEQHPQQPRRQESFQHRLSSQW